MTRIHSVAGALSHDRPLLERPPFRAPHHTASSAAVVGGGPGPRPGEASLAHRGVLLLDELAEFQRPVLGVAPPAARGRRGLDCPSERTGALPGALSARSDDEPVPVRWAGRSGGRVLVLAQRLAAFRDKLSRALLDRFDLVVTVPRARAAELAAPAGEPSAAVRERVLAARERLGRPPRRTPAASELLDRAVERLPLSGRGRARVARVARTIAALAGADDVSAGARRRGARVPVAAGAGGVSELALAAFAAATGSHVAGAAASARFARSRAASTRRQSGAARARRAALPRTLGVGFPPLLSAIHDPPPGLYVRGSAPLELLARPAVAVVGARACSSYGATSRGCSGVSSARPASSS